MPDLPPESVIEIIGRDVGGGWVSCRKRRPFETAAAGYPNDRTDDLLPRHPAGPSSRNPHVIFEPPAVFGKDGGCSTASAVGSRQVTSPMGSHAGTPPFQALRVDCSKTAVRDRPVRDPLPVELPATSRPHGLCLRIRCIPCPPVSSRIGEIVSRAGIRQLVPRDLHRLRVGDGFAVTPHATLC